MTTAAPMAKKRNSHLTRIARFPAVGRSAYRRVLFTATNIG